MDLKISNRTCLYLPMIYWKNTSTYVTIYLFTHQIHFCFSHFSPKIAQVITVHITRGVPKKVWCTSNEVYTCRTWKFQIERVCTCRWFTEKIQAHTSKFTCLPTKYILLNQIHFALVINYAVLSISTFISRFWTHLWNQQFT